MADLAEMQATIAAAAERSGPAVVGLGRGWALGSGVVIDHGKVLTCAHNLRREEVTVTLADGRARAARWPRPTPIWTWPC